MTDDKRCIENRQDCNLCHNEARPLPKPLSLDDDFNAYSNQEIRSALEFAENQLEGVSYHSYEKCDCDLCTWYKLATTRAIISYRQAFAAVLKKEGKG